MKRLLLLLFLLPLIFSVTDTTSAGGGIFMDVDERNPWIRIEGIDVRFIVDSNAGTVTAEIQQEIWGGPNHYIWLYPVPDDNPIVELGGDGYGPSMGISSPRLIAPINPCRVLRFNNLPSYDYGPYNTTFDGDVETNQSVIAGDDMAQWLTDNDFAFEPQQIMVIEDYAEQGMSFVAVEYITEPSISNGDVRYFVPIRITYSADEVMLPLRLMSFLSIDLKYNQEIPIHVTIEGDGQYISSNYANVSLDYSLLRGVHVFAHLDVISEAGYSINSPDYSRNRSSVLNVRDGQAFLTERAGRNIDAKPWDPYITSLYAQIPPTSMTQDVYFEIDPYRRATPDEIDLGTLTDPLDFWGCSTRTLRANGHHSEFPIRIARYEDIEKNLPEGFTWSRGGGTRHPEGWIVSVFEFPISVAYDRQILAFSPQKVTSQMIFDYFAGESTPPMLLYVPPIRGEDIPQPPFSGSPIPRSELPSYTYTPSRHLWSINSWIVILTSDEDFAQNRSMYRAMLRYPFTFRYLRHPELLHTLYYGGISIAYPEGWLERMEDDEHMIIMPEDALDMATSPYVRVYPISDIATESIDLSNLEFEERLDVVTGWIADHFNVDRDLMAEAIAIDSRRGCNPIRGVMSPFSANGQTGYIQYVWDIYDDTQLLIEISAPDDIYPEYAEVLEQISQAVGVFNGYCG